MIVRFLPYLLTSNSIIIVLIYAALQMYMEYNDIPHYIIPCSPKGDYLYKVVDHASRAVVEVENVETLSGMTFPKPSLGDQDPITEAMWAVSVAGSKHAFLLMLLDNVHRQTGRYLLLASNE
jgi:hypothetical protein